MTLSVSTATGTGTASAKIAQPSGGWASGNTLVAIVFSQASGGAGAYPTLSPPSGWTIVTSTQNIFPVNPPSTYNNTVAAVYVLTLSSAGPANYHFTTSSGDSIAVTAFEYPASLTSGAVDVSASTATSSTTASFPAVTTTATNDLIILGIASSGATLSSTTPPTGYTNELGTTAMPNVFDAVQSAAGSTGTPSVTTTSGLGTLTFTVALQLLNSDRLSASPSFGSPSSSGAGVNVVAGTGAVSLGTVAAAANLLENESLAASPSLGAFTAASTATAKNTGTGAPSFGALTVSDVVFEGIQLTSAPSFGALLASSSIYALNFGSATTGPNFGALTTSGNFLETDNLSGQGAFAIPSVAGTLSSLLAGTATPSFGVATVSGNLLEKDNLSGSASFGAFATATSITVTDPETGAVTFGPLTAQVAGTFSVVGTAPALFGPLTVTTSANSQNTGSSGTGYGTYLAAANLLENDSASGTVNFAGPSAAVIATQKNSATAAPLFGSLTGNGAGTAFVGLAGLPSLGTLSSQGTVLEKDSAMATLAFSAPTFSPTVALKNSAVAGISFGTLAVSIADTVTYLPVPQSVAAGVSTPESPTVQSHRRKTKLGAIIDLYTLDATANGGPIMHWTPGTFNDAPISFGGVQYTPLPIEISGLEWTTQGALPQPKLTISNLYQNVGGYARMLVVAYGDLVGATLTRLRTFDVFLDGRPYANSAETEEPVIYRVNRKSAQNKDTIEFELASTIDQQGRELPGRQVLRDVCTHTYRYWNGSSFIAGSCPYAGTSYFDANGNSVSSPSADVCGFRLGDCLARFGPNTGLPTRAFPGVAQTQV